MPTPQSVLSALESAGHGLTSSELRRALCARNSVDHQRALVEALNQLQQTGQIRCTDERRQGAVWDLARRAGR